MNHRVYHYVGSKAIQSAISESPGRACIRSTADVLVWTQNRLSKDSTVTVTFIIDTDKQLWINDQRSEHVHCAAGQDVLSAGEMTFLVRKQHVEVIEVTNQSTGYCPEPESWSAVAQVLDNAALPHPDDFTTAYLFRRCEVCGTTNIIKDDWFVCAVCQSPLNQSWNYNFT